MLIRNIGTTFLLTTATILAGCGNDDDSNTEPQVTPITTTGDFSDLSGYYAVLSTTLPSGELQGDSALVVSPSGVAYFAVGGDAGQFHGISTLSGTGSDFEAVIDVYDPEGDYSDTVTISGTLTKEQTQTTLMVESNQLTDTFPMIYATEVESNEPVTDILSKTWTVLEEYEDQFTDFTYSGETISFSDDVGCSYSGTISPSPGSIFVNDESMDLSSYEYIGTIANCSDTEFVGFVSVITIGTPAGDMQAMSIMVQSESNMTSFSLEQQL